MQPRRPGPSGSTFQRLAVVAASGVLFALAVPAAASMPLGATRAATAAPTTAAPATAAPAYFHTLPPGTKLPTGSQCAAWVRARPVKENKGVNRKDNRTTGHTVSKSFFSGDKAQANNWIAPRINGNFTGTTEEILRWAACKWGIDQNMVFAQAA